MMKLEHSFLGTIIYGSPARDATLLDVRAETPPTKASCRSLKVYTNQQRRSRIASLHMLHESQQATNEDAIA